MNNLVYITRQILLLGLDYPNIQMSVALQVDLFVTVDMLSFDVLYIDLIKNVVLRHHLNLKM